MVTLDFGLELLMQQQLLLGWWNGLCENCPAQQHGICSQASKENSWQMLEQPGGFPEITAAVAPHQEWDLWDLCHLCSGYRSRSHCTR